MNQNPRIRPDPSSTTPSWNHKPADPATSFFSGQDGKNVTRIAQALAAHGGGPGSADLAFDLVLNDLVKQAQDSTGATGAAIALLRDGEMVCRATTGDSAPDLGVRVETTSGLAGACWSLGQMQQCRDTETDGRVSAEVCRRLGVRSMLIAPLADGRTLFGILQLFSAWPNAFGEREISTLQVLARKIAENKREVEASVAAVPSVEEEPEVIPLLTAENVSPPEVIPLLTAENVSPKEAPRESAEPERMSFSDREKPKGNELWAVLLFVLVVATAMLLGLVIGRHGAAMSFPGGSQAATVPPSAASANSTAIPEVQPVASVPPSDLPEPSNLRSAPESKGLSSTNSAHPPSGGLIVTDKGKVIYRSSPEAGGATPAVAERSGTRLVHRVEPQYPREARLQNIQGPVVLDIQINGNGAVGNIEIVSGNPLLANAAVQAVRQWRYKPYFVDGHAVESQTRITVKFTLPTS